MPFSHSQQVSSHKDIAHQLSRRREIIFDVPVITINASAFCWGTCHDESIKHQICAFIPGFKKTGIQQGQMLFCMREIVDNAYDAYALRGLKYGCNLVIKAVVQEKNGKIFIKIKNNGPSFTNLPNGRLYPISKIEYSNKEKTGVLGGRRLGLRITEKYVNQYGGKLFVKNRKKGGAAVYMEFPASPRARL